MDSKWFSDFISCLLISCFRFNKYPGPEDPALIHLGGVWFIKPAPKEVMPVFSRPYLKKIPPDIAATQYLGFAPMNPYKSSPYSSNSKYWVAAT